MEIYYPDPYPLGYFNSPPYFPLAKKAKKRDISNRAGNGKNGTGDR